MTTRILMVGAGGVATRHAEVLSGLADVQVTGVTDPVPEAAQRLASACAAPAYADLHQAFDAARPDAVYVCVPPFAHGEPERAALARGLPFFVEKPLGVDLAVAEEVAAEVDRQGLVTGTGYHWRCLDVLDGVHDLLADGTGPALASGYWLDKRPPVTWWGDATLSGGQVVEQLTHVLDLATVLLGPAAQVCAMGTGSLAGPRAPGDAGNAAPGEPVDDATAALVRFRSGAVATFAATSVLAVKHRAGLTLYLPGTVVEVSEAGTVVHRDGDRVECAPGEDPKVLVDREFVAAVRGERETTRAPYPVALESHRLACAIATAVRTGEAVDLACGAG